MDRLDRKILALLQEDATLPVSDVARKVGLSTTPCWRRIQKMEENGVIKERVAILDPDKVNAGVTIFVSINTGTHSAEWLADFARHVASLSEVVEVYRMSGEVDYLLRVLVPNMSAVDAFHRRLVSKVNIRKVSLSFAIEKIKYGTQLPLNYMQLSDGRYAGVA
jgi:Lrp/AsnC family transcriptional regulator